MRGARVFIDTNTLLYLHDLRDPQKTARAANWLRSLTNGEAARINLQVLNEATHVLLRRKWYDTPATVFEIVDQLAQLGATPVTWAEIDAARVLHQRLHYSWWACLLLASALELGCTYFLSEDLQDGHRVEANGKALTIIDPFAHSPERIQA